MDYIVEAGTFGDNDDAVNGDVGDDEKQKKKKKRKKKKKLKKEKKLNKTDLEEEETENAVAVADAGVGQEEADVLMNDNPPNQVPKQNKLARSQTRLSHQTLYIIILQLLQWNSTSLCSTNVII
jgi:hypothetical protein